ncbi:MAG: M20/M25/M40 family metallo-hydrolase [Clostridia bacterium]|nr:M20/M25/M40 family metallo-hydrolase [Clostridia bacterium]
MQQLFHEIEALNEEYIKVWAEVCNIESPTDYKEGVDACGRYIADLAKKKGWQVEVEPMEASGDVVCITMNPDAKGNPISLSGHIDTVHPVGTFGTPAVRIEGEKIHGPGVVDCKGGVVAGLLAMDALQQVGFTARPIRMLLQTDEEVSSRFSHKATVRYICEKAKDSAAFLNLEGNSKGKICIARKGIAPYKLTVSGQEAHASKCFESGANAIAEAAHIILRLEQLKDGEGITCNCGVIQGGTVTNTVPKHCELRVDFRYVNKEQLAEIQRLVAEIEQTPQIPGCSCKAEPISLRLPMERVERNEKLLEKINNIFAANGLPVLDGSGTRTGGSDAADVTDFGIPCVDSIGTQGEGIHSPHEFAWLSSLEESAKRIAAVIYGF